MLFKLSCPHLLSAADADADAAAAAAAAVISQNHSIPKTSFGGIQLVRIHFSIIINMYRFSTTWDIHKTLHHVVYLIL